MIYFTIEISVKGVLYKYTYSLHFKRNMAKRAPSSRTPIDEATSTSNHVSSMLDTAQVSISEKMTIIKADLKNFSGGSQGPKFS